jgi:hypothetical protein
MIDKIDIYNNQLRQCNSRISQTFQNCWPFWVWWFIRSLLRWLWLIIPCVYLLLFCFNKVYIYNLRWLILQVKNKLINVAFIHKEISCYWMPGSKHINLLCLNFCLAILYSCFNLTIDYRPHRDWKHLQKLHTFRRWLRPHPALRSSCAYNERHKWNHGRSYS